MVMNIWDLVISGGTIFIVKAILQLLEANRNLLIGGLDGDGVLVGLGELEKGPFGIIDFICTNQMNLEVESEATYSLKLECLAKMSKENIKSYPIEKYEYDRLKVHYWNIHEPILKFWSEPSSLESLEEKKKILGLGSRVNLGNEDLSDNVI